MVSRRHIRYRLIPAVLLVLAAAGTYCLWNGRMDRSDSGHQEKEIILSWYDFFLELERYTEGFRVPVAARTYGLTGIAAYETMLPLLPDHISFLENHTDCKLPDWPADQPLDGPSALNATLAACARSYFFNVRKDKWQELLNLEEHWRTKITPCESCDTAASIDWGRQIAERIYTWSSSDSIAHMGQTHIYDMKYENGPPGTWQTEGIPAILPNWGLSRTLVVPVGSIPLEQPDLFAPEKSSRSHYKDALEVFTLSHKATPESRWITEFWSDDHHGLTFTPASRWISICNQLVQKTDPGLPTVLEAYLKLGLGLHDAAVICWYEKYKYKVIRPDTYIQTYLDSSWTPPGGNPHFPSYPSGHACFGGTSAEILINIFGDIPLTDRSHEGRIEFKGTPRSFTSIREMAAENAYSRVLLGVHFRKDCEEGMRVGSLIGQKIDRIRLQRMDMLGIK